MALCPLLTPDGILLLVSQRLPLLPCSIPVGAWLVPLVTEGTVVTRCQPCHVGLDGQNRGHPRPSALRRGGSGLSPLWGTSFLGSY
jgi:hypothetical protein